MHTAHSTIAHRISVSNDARYLTAGQVRVRFGGVQRHVDLASHAGPWISETGAFRWSDQRTPLAHQRRREMGAATNQKGCAMKSAQMPAQTASCRP